MNPIRRICRSLAGLPQRAGALLASASLVTLVTAVAVVPLAGLADAQQLARSPGGKLPATPGDAVIAWNSNAAAAALGACLAPANNPLHESRMYAMMHLAIHDALNAIDRRFRPYVLTHVHARGASAEAAVAAAARGVLIPVLRQLPPPFSGCVTGAKVAEGVQAEYAAAAGAIPGGPAKTRGLAVGRAAAAAILAARTADGSDTPLFDTAYPQGTRPASTGSPPARASRSHPAGPASPRSP